MLSFSITVSPDHESLGSPGFVLEVLSDWSGILPDFGNNGCLKEFKWIARGPFRELEGKFVLEHMASHGRYRKSGVGVGIVEVIVSYILIAALPLQRESSHCE